LRPNSVPRQAFLAAVRLYELCVSQATLAELQEVMRRPKFDRYAPLLASRLWRPCEAPIFAPHGLA
jgi:predicted nucleic acid-binding protein